MTSPILIQRAPNLTEQEHELVPQLDWHRFATLPGSQETNWEMLCGAVVRRTFGSLGRLRYLAQQPGVEFHLKVERTSGALGEAGRWWGWQCRWYDLPASGRIGARRRRGIEDAIRKTEEHVPGITDWVLWTKRPLTPPDQQWFFGLVSAMGLHLWTEEDLDAHLVGEAEILRRTYFGDLVLTTEGLHSLRNRAIAPVRERWIPEVHVEVDAERTIRRVLAEPQCWPEIGGNDAELTASIDELTDLADELEDEFCEAVISLTADLHQLREALRAVDHAFAEHALSHVTQLFEVEWNPLLSRAQGRQLARALRRRRHLSSFAVQAALSLRHDSAKLLSELRKQLSVNVLALIGPAGSGKTQLAAQLTVERSDRPSGVYLEAWPLQQRGSINDLLARLGLPAASFYEVLEAVDAAGARAGTRLPVVIDGLNESEEPATWKAELAALRTAIERFRHIVVVVTLRPSAATIALPEDLPRLELEGYGSLTLAAVEKYFAHYKIDPGTLRLPLGNLRNPLFLRIFCEATNHERKLEVAPRDVPTSLHTTFARYRETVIERIASPPGGVSRDTADVHRALDAIALSFWGGNRRAIPFRELRGLIRDDGAEWSRSLARAFVEGGILTRDPDTRGDQRTTILFDAFAGFLIADALTRQMDPREFRAWIVEDVTLVRLSTDLGAAHPLASDIRRAFAGLVPQALRMPFWSLVEGSLQTEALVDAAELEGPLLDDDTVREIGRVALIQVADRRDLLNRLRWTRDVAGHPLNAQFLDRLLSSQPPTDRDLRWSEWIRRQEDGIRSDLYEFIEEWQVSTDRAEGDHLRALWVKWLLTSTLRDLRDLATCALYWYGRGEPGALFQLALSSLDTNDPYIPERLLAAAFGVMMAAPGEQREFGDELPHFLEGLWKAFCADEPTNPTDHWLMRDYVDGIVGVTRRYYTTALGEWSGDRKFAPPSRPDPIPHDDRRTAAVDLVHGMDFKNYTVGRLVPGRGNYQYNHPGYEEVLSWIRGRVWDLGWRSDRFTEIERSMTRYRRTYNHRHGRVESYRKKYGWIGFFEAAGRLVDENRSPLRPDEPRLTDADIDPSFPARPPTPELSLPGWLSKDSTDLQRWIIDGHVDVPDELLRSATLQGSAGPWVALSGFLVQEDIESRRRAFGFLHGILVRRADERSVRTALHERLLPVDPSALRGLEESQVFAGEMTWSPSVRQGASAAELPKLYAGSIAGPSGEAFAVELPFHHYGWESSRSVMNGTGEQPMPAITFAEAFDLRVVPASLDWCDPQGRLASMTLSAPAGFDATGSLLYLREDLVRQYCDQHDYELVWIVWGERQLRFADPLTSLPEWCTQAYRDESNIWRRVATLSELARSEPL